MKWYSSRIRLVCLIENIGATRYADSVCLFSADSFEQAFGKALAFGKKQEDNYKNIDGESVQWRLKELMTLDLIDGDILDGIEVYSESVALEKNEEYSFDHGFSPENSNPTQTI